MKYLRMLRKLFLYAGIEKQDYDQLLPSIREENLVLLKVFSELAAAMFFLLYILSAFFGSFVTVNRMSYLASTIGMLILLLCVHLVLPKHPALIMLVVYIFEIILFGFGIRISMLHADKAAVSAVAFLLVSPLLFYDRPIRISALIAAVVATFSTLVVQYKDPSVAESDIWNMITFGFVAITTTVFMMCVKICSLAQSRQIIYLSQTDLLTGVKNRNHFENRLKEYSQMFSSNLICVYADVNGLHEMNNRQGHAAGDCMLRDVAEAMRKCFGSEHTYRIGGDEFVGFHIDGNPQEVSSAVDQLKGQLSKKGYHVSFGIALREKAQGSLDTYALVNEAEKNMFEDKREFYRQSKNDRRSR